MMVFDNYGIRNLAAEDAEAFFELIRQNRSRLEDFVAGIVLKTNNIGDTTKWIGDITESMARRSHFPYVVTDRTTKSLIGFIEVKNIDWAIPKGEIGYFIDWKNTGKGIGEKMLRIISSYCFSQLQFRKLLLRIHEQNHSSRKLAAKCGFSVEGLIRNDYRKMSGEVVDMLYYGKRNDE
jgi:ribosomal-protein-serine acetyltransferase